MTPIFLRLGWEAITARIKPLNTSPDVWRVMSMAIWAVRRTISI
jgi:hypothetical protein